MTITNSARIHITGIVQGVGFRPFVYGLALQKDLNGWVRNTSAGVDIEVDGQPAGLKQFIQALKDETPPLARIDSFEFSDCPPTGFTSFKIVHSEPVPGAFIPISPDVSICDDCLRELFDPENHRYLYPFINCTNCGPRFTIIQDIPYDRPKTTMANFEMCPICRTEYEDPLDRRFHAQPVACAVCGPKVWLENSNQIHPVFQKLDAIQQTQKLILAGNIISIKGLGGFHLACDGTNPDAVQELRNRKLRREKPFALMMPDISTVQRHCYVNKDEQKLLESRQRPIVLLKRKPDSPLPLDIAPGQNTLGVMLPYTPLHFLIFAQDLFPGIQPPSTLVMTSANLREEPIAYRNEHVHQQLCNIADSFLMHNRDIHTRCDDSVIRIFEKTGPEKQARPYLLRRSRGYAPDPIIAPFEMPPVLATGAELKNTFCLTQEIYAFLSHHIGDLQNHETLISLEISIEHFERLFRIDPQAIAYDLHPNYLASRYALARAESKNIPAVGVQHHHAHIASCMADNSLNGQEPVIGVALDGTGYGDDDAIWGGEFLLADYNGYLRYAHLAYTPLPGGDAAIRNPGRMALSYLWQADLPWEADIIPVDKLCGEDRHVLHSLLENKINAPLTSSVGRLFDAAAALAGVRQTVNYEAQAAIEFEALADPHEGGAYPFEFNHHQLDPAPMLQALIADQRAEVPISTISAKFHNGLAVSIFEICQQMRTQFGVHTVALSGGVWQNITLLTKTTYLLERQGFNILIHRQVPTNDGGLSLGQAMIAKHSI
jgi:hydrogenase maturation protein HypF